MDVGRSSWPRCRTGAPAARATSARSFTAHRAPCRAAVAWRCAQRGLAVSLVDPGATRGAWNTAAGMLAPITELHYTETPLLRLSLDSLARYAGFAAEVSEESGRPTGFLACGTVLAA